MTSAQDAALDPSWDIADRMRKALREAGLGSKEMAEYFGVSRTSISSWINGRVVPSTQTLRLWAMRCGVRYEWLKDGDAPTPTPALVDEGGPRGARTRNLRIISSRFAEIIELDERAA